MINTAVQRPIFKITLPNADPAVHPQSQISQLGILCAVNWLVIAPFTQPEVGPDLGGQVNHVDTQKYENPPKPAGFGVVHKHF